VEWDQVLFYVEPVSSAAEGQKAGE
jgi:hypothetical protein